MDQSVIRRLGLAGVALACLVGCGDSGGGAPAPSLNNPTKSMKTAKGNGMAAPAAGLNPNYHGSAAADDAKVGSLLKK